MTSFKPLSISILLFFFSLNLLATNAEERDEFDILKKQSIPISKKMRNLIVDVHNEARSNVSIFVAIHSVVHIFSLFLV